MSQNTGIIRRFFVPDELVLLVRSKLEINVEEREFWEGWLAELASRTQLPFRIFLGVGEEYPAITSFQVDGSNSVSVEDEGGNTFDWEAIRPGQYYSLLVLLPDAGGAEQAVITAVNILSQDVTPDVDEEFERFRLIEVSPNWTFASSQTQLIGGGPGSYPVEEPVYNPDDETVASSTLDAIPSSLRNMNVSGEANVVVFDTVPDLARWNAVTNPANPPLAPFQAGAFLRSMQGQLNIIPFLPIQVPPDAPPSAAYAHAYDYPIPDHGIFVSSLVHSTAPKANLYLVKVLNKYGAGTLYGLSAALAAFQTGQIPLNDPSLPLIVNLSLTVSFELKPNPDIISLLINLGKNIQMIMFQVALQSVSKAFNHEVIFLAAAGNDGQGTATIPAPRHPAAFPEVIGVGALDSTHNLAEYSNRADIPPSDGLLTFGGDAVRLPQLRNYFGAPVFASGSQGLLGIYIHDFPIPPASGVVTSWGRVASRTGWARWSGTSFAAGIMSGVFANAVSRGVPLRGIKAALEQAASKPAGSPAKVDAVQP